MINLYKGYSSFEYERNKSFKLTDVELVKMDLLNHIFTRKGERVMMPTFGTSIPDLLFEPIDEQLLDQLYEELETVFEYDPRVSVIQLKITPDADNHTVNVTADLFYVEINMNDRFEINLEFGSGAPA